MGEASTGKLYTTEFFNRIADARRSANAVVPIVLAAVPARSVVDVGCGEGGWLSVFRDRGISDVFGVDGDYVDRSRLQIDASLFRAHDLTKPLDLGRRFDLAVCLEVAEHLPEQSAGALVDSLCAASDRVLFSAAIPFQLGWGHIHLRFQGYWAGEFAKRGYQCFDLVRPRVWQDSAVEPWYAQNTLFYVNEKADPELCARLPRPLMIDVVHPDQYVGSARAATSPGEWLSVPSLVRALPIAFARAARRRLGQKRHP